MTTVRVVKSETGLRALKAGQLGRDSEVRGLRFQALADGRVAAVYRYGAGGSDKVTLGHWPAQVLKDLRERCRGLKAARAQGKDPKLVVHAERQAEREAQQGVRAELSRRRDTFMRAVRDYVDEHASQRTKNWQDTLACLTQVAAAVGPERPVSEVTRAEVVKHLDKVSSPAQAIHTRAALSHLGGWLLDRGRLPENPWRRLPVAVKVEPRERYLGGWTREDLARDPLLPDEPNEVGQLLAALPTAPVNEDVRALVEMQLYTGARLGEVAGARWTEVDLRARLWTVPRDRAKAKEVIKRPLSAPVIELLMRRPSRAGEYLFPRRDGKPLRVDNAAQEIRRWQKDLALPGGPYASHDSRRTLAVHMARLGVQDGLIERALGHKPKGVTGTHYQKDEFLGPLRRAYEALAERYETLAREAREDERAREAVS